jgi:predicted PurR-regulated permease PerM
MKDDLKDEKAPSRLQIIYFASVLLFILALTFLIFKPFITALVVAMTMAVVVEPVYEYLLRKVKNSRIIAAIITVILIIILILIPLIFLGKQVFDEARDTYITLGINQDTPVFGTDFVQGKIQNIFPNLNIDIRDYVADFSEWLFSHTGSFFTGTLDIVLKTFLGIIAVFYFLKDGPRFRKAFVDLSPLPEEYDEKIINTLKLSMKSIVRGTFLVAVAQGTLAGLGFYIFGLPNPALWGMVAAISALIPGIGTSLVMIPAVLFLFLTSTLASALGLLIWGALLVGMIDNFLTPKLLERGINIHPLLILFSVIGGIALFGIGGFIMGPLILSLLFTLFDIYDLFINHEKKQGK